MFPMYDIPRRPLFDHDVRVLATVVGGILAMLLLGWLTYIVRGPAELGF
ncbi:MAG: hypothetical protein HUU35_06970 [Armatimonadetes bacterium]|nr:hypothetical protein [Armatimonadota bacterium]